MTAPDVDYASLPDRPWISWCATSWASGRYVDLSGLVSPAGVVLHHGGSGLFVGSVLGGAPHILFPMCADQPFNGDLVQRLEVGEVLDPESASSARIADRTAALRADVEMRTRVSALREETIALPEPAEVVAAVEALVASS